MFKRHTSNCHRCGAVLRRESTVCAACCAPQGTDTPQPAREPVAAAVSASAGPVSNQTETGLGAWPFGQADAEAAAQVAARGMAAEVRSELGHYSAQSTTHVLGTIPAQRPAQPQEHLESVPSTGPNPFLAAARMQHARDEAAAVEGYPV